MKLAKVCACVSIGAAVIGLGGCGQNPRSELDQLIKQYSFIPFELPMPSFHVGTILHGNNNALFLVAPDQTCFPNLPGDQALRELLPTNIPNQESHVEVDFKANVQPVLASGNATIDFNLSATYVKSVDISFSGAAVEYLNEMAFWSYYQHGMSEPCREALNRYPFIGQGLRINRMSFVFKDQSGSAINLTANLSQIVNISAGVKWSIQNNYTLVISTPKYIGYRMARLDSKSSVPKILYATTTDSQGNWVFRDFGLRMQSMKDALRFPVGLPKN